METPLPSTPLPPCCSLKSKLVCLSAGLVVLLLVAILSFLLGRASINPSPLSQNLPTPTAVIPTPTPDPTANWKTYKNAKYAISFKYPEETVLSEEKDNPSAGQFLILFDKPNFNLNIMQIREGFNEKYYLDFSPNETFSLNSVLWQVFLAPQGYCDAGQCGDPFISYRTTHGGYEFVFTFLGLAQKNVLHSQILSTFKFLD